MAILRDIRDLPHVKSFQIQHDASDTGGLFYELYLWLDDNPNVMPLSVTYGNSLDDGFHEWLTVVYEA
jgi:hypothetical protein